VPDPQRKGGDWEVAVINEGGKGSFTRGGQGRRRSGLLGMGGGVTWSVLEGRLNRG